MRRCLLLDFLKGFLPVVLSANLLRVAGETPLVSLPFLWGLTGELPADKQLFAHTVQVVTALAAIMGHNYSIFLRGRGGKGIATSAGVLVALSPMIFLGALLVFAVTFYFSRYVSLGSIIGVLSIPVLLHLTDRLQHVDGDKTQPTIWEAGTWNKPLMVFSLIAAGLAIWRHRSNIQRILTGTEDRLSARGPEPEQPAPEDPHPKEDDNAT